MAAMPVGECGDGIIVNSWLHSVFYDLKFVVIARQASYGTFKHHGSEMGVSVLRCARVCSYDFRETLTCFDFIEEQK